MITRETPAMDKFAIAAGLMLMAMLAFNLVAPYACAFAGPQNCAVPDDLIRQIDQNQNTIQNLAIALFSFLFGASMGSRMKDTTISAMVESSKALPTPPPTGVSVAMQPGDEMSVTAAKPGDPPE
jgi:hypothetical protein